MGPSLPGQLEPGIAALEQLSRHEMGIGGAEIMAYSERDAVLLATLSQPKAMRHGIEVIDLSDPHAPHLLRYIDLSGTAFPEPAGAIDSVSSVAVDPHGRGLAAATIIPRHSNLAGGMVVLFDYRDGRLLRSIEVGHHPDSVTFSGDGRFVVTADEAEYQAHGAPQAPGSISVIQLGDSEDLDAAARQAQIGIYPLAAPYLADGVDLRGLRRHHGDAETPLVEILEPEYVSELNGEVYVSLQENNALAVFDISLRKWVRVFDLGTRLVTIDASDRDGPKGAVALKVDDEVHGLLMPDTIKAFTFNGRPLVATANEGDARSHDEGDVMRLKHAGRNAPDLAPATRKALKSRYGANPLRDEFLGRLEISRIDGLDAMGRIERPTMFGTRGFSILDGRTGEVVYDSGSFIETFVVRNDPATHNMNNGKAAERDARSPSKGPEIEALAVAQFDDELWIAVGSERQNGIFVFRGREPAQLRLHAYANPHAEGDFSPESMMIIPAAKRTDKRHLLVAAFEGSGSILVYALQP